jgi:hypothetical protein
MEIHIANQKHVMLGETYDVHVHYSILAVK